jgi:hypothetical protein
MTRMSPRGSTRPSSSDAALPYMDARELAMLEVGLSPVTLPNSSAQADNRSHAGLLLMQHGQKCPS